MSISYGHKILKKPKYYVKNMKYGDIKDGGTS